MVRPDPRRSCRPMRPLFTRPPDTIWRTWPTSPGDRGRTAAVFISPMSSPASMHSGPFRPPCTSGTAVKRADGYVMLAIASEKTFQSLIKVIGHPEWTADPRFAIYADRRENWAALMNGVESWSHTLTTEKCLAELNGHGVPCSAYRTVAEALRDPQISHRGALTEVRDGGGKFKVLNLPFRMSGAIVSAGERVETLGEHTVAFLRESGLSEEEISVFTEKSLAAEPR